MDFVNLTYSNYDDSIKYKVLAELLDDNTFNNYVVKDVKIYGSLNKSFHHWNEIYYLLSKGQYRYSSFKSWSNIIYLKAGKKKKRTNNE